MSLSKPADGADYQVFLSFRGPDTRQGFTDCLYHFLVDAGIRVFRDNEEIRPGEKIQEILRAISNSIVCIPIFSRDYASSKWCLRELAEMVEQKKKIMPIFYDVTPDDVKLKTSLYRDALTRHEKENEKELWEKALKEVVEVSLLESSKDKEEKALTEVVKIKGWEVKDIGHGELSKSIVGEVLVNLKAKDKIITNHLIGMDEQVKTVSKFLNVHADDIRYVGIYGIAGCGKTTLAKKEHIESLAGSFSWFSKGSRIIVTTRDIRVVAMDQEELMLDEDTPGKTKVLTLEMKEMNSEEALQLFSSHAFRMTYPPTDYLNLSKEIVSVSGGLPLALEIIGSQLRGKRKEEWEDKLNTLASIPHENIQKKLMIIYEALEYRTKQIFLDIACLPVNTKTANAISMWRSCGFHPDVGVKDLISMSLIKIVHEDDEFWMHDHLRDMGKEIACMENFTDFGKRSRLWNHEEALGVLKRKEGTRKIEVLYLSDDSHRENYPLVPENFKKLCNLRYLRLRGLAIQGDFENLLSKLSWLCWPSCPSNLKATNLKLTRLAILDLSQSHVSENWKGWSRIQGFQKALSLCVEVN
ncbi:hypothetical protein CRG98_026383 [Punica granatum]|uniref:TIR domain-containing protein n=1 Tax=Punica granatum TaxID=22663 RepID=A0A2I0JAG8_PUNGR|nr:hypothetical protein CRG98_026383 [Punica granatum]